MKEHLQSVLKRLNTPFFAGLTALGLLMVGTFLFAWRAEYSNQKILDRLAEIEKRTGDLEEYTRNHLISSSTERDSQARILREVVREESQEEQLTSAVANVAPSVVSIVVTKDVPKLEIVYENPFGNDPMFRDFGIRIPRYRQKGLETQKVGSGTGFIVRSDGYVVTNRHVVQDTEARYTVLLSNGSQEAAQVIYRDSSFDVAILKIAGSGYRRAPLGISSDLKLGQSVFAVGNALGEYNNSVSLGIISGLNRTIQASDGFQVETLEGVIQTDAAVNPGNSGGPLVNFDGQVIGVNVATVIGSNNISFAIPIDTVKKIITPILGTI
ncbi:MAG: trypsin-like peptidase domain-containing protein [Anaplasmataceae bacterium]|nr:trypsin-like peptidase domain-containing protein [Anaplasmataceae bacterium]